MDDAGGSCYEGRICPLMRFGCNRDGKRGRPQVVHIVPTAPGGRPVAVQAYPGNTNDSNTVADQVLKLREHFGSNGWCRSGIGACSRRCASNTSSATPGWAG